MAFAAENSPKPTTTSSSAFDALRLALALALMATAANCFLKYLWWTACYSAWSGIPKMATQWRAAGARSSFYGWSVVLLELASVALAYAGIQLRGLNGASLRTGLRIASSLVITLLVTGLWVLALSWIKQSH